MRTAFVLLGMFLAVPRVVFCQGKGQHSAWLGADSIVTVGPARIGLRVSAWRDFMPQPEGAQAGSPLMVNLQIMSLDSLPMPTELRVDSAWVRSEDELWSSAPSPEPRPNLPNGLDLILRGGPKWPTHQTIDVLVRLRPAAGAAYYLRARRQPIGRTM
ncbi:MAG TPA: hypothetical protein VJ808_07430 [Gemmatimonadales bacterium]|nr:hypothetical protein [Gemmatimonadales bacterium]